MSGHIPDTFLRYRHLLFSRVTLALRCLSRLRDIWRFRTWGSAAGLDLLFQPTSRGTPAGVKRRPVRLDHEGILGGPSCVQAVVVVVGVHLSTVCKRRIDGGVRLMENTQICGRYVETLGCRVNSVGQCCPGVPANRSAERFDLYLNEIHTQHAQCVLIMLI